MVLGIAEKEALRRGEGLPTDSLSPGLTPFRQQLSHKGGILRPVITNCGPHGFPSLRFSSILHAFRRKVQSRPLETGACFFSHHLLS